MICGMFDERDRFAQADRHVSVLKNASSANAQCLCGHSKKAMPRKRLNRYCAHWRKAFAASRSTVR